MSRGRRRRRGMLLKKKVKMRRQEENFLEFVAVKCFSIIPLILGSYLSITNHTQVASKC